MEEGGEKKKFTTAQNGHSQFFFFSLFQGDFLPSQCSGTCTRRGKREGESGREGGEREIDEFGECTRREGEERERRERREGERRGE